MTVKQSVKEISVIFPWGHSNYRPLYWVSSSHGNSRNTVWGRLTEAGKRRLIEVIHNKVKWVYWSLLRHVCHTCTLLFPPGFIAGAELSILRLIWHLFLAALDFLFTLVYWMLSIRTDASAFLPWAYFLPGNVNSVCNNQIPLTLSSVQSSSLMDYKG